MLRKRRVLTIVLVLTIVAIVGAMVLSACQIKLNNPPEDNDNVDTPNDEQGTTQEPEQDTTQHPEQDADTTPDVTPDPKPPIVEQKTEAEYKAMFEAELPRVIENYFNENVSLLEKMNISNVNVLTINNNNGDVYLKGTINNKEKFYIANCNQLSSLSSYKEANDKLNNLTFNFGNAQTVQTETLANEIAEFALEQDKVIEYLINNGVDYSNYEVLNATEFDNDGTGRMSNLTIKFADKIFSMTMGGPTGVCSTQEEYLNKLKSGRLRVLKNFNVDNYKELEVASK